MQQSVISSASADTDSGREMKIGIFSGSFDPVHCGHAMAANYLAQYCGLDRVWMMPSPLNPLKTASPPADASRRLDMCRIVAAKCAGVHVSDFEFSLPSPSYTYRTLSALRETYPQHDFVLVIGSDNWLSFKKWRNPEEIISEFGLIIYPRPGYDVEGPLPENVILLKEAPVALISSTFIRQAVASGRNLNYFVDSDVADYIRMNSLYRP